MIATLPEPFLKEFGEAAQREGLSRRPERVERALRYLTSGDHTNVKDLCDDSCFVENYGELAVVRDVDLSSSCVPSKQTVNAVGGAKPARLLKVGDRLWTLERGSLKETVVTQVTSRKTREMVEVLTAGGRFKVTPDHPVMTESTWVEARHLEPGMKVEWINSKSLCRKPYEPQPGYALGYVLGAVAADGSLQEGRRLALIVGDQSFAEKYRARLTEAFPGCASEIEAVSVPSGFLGREIPMFRVRTVSRAIGEKLCRWLGVSEKGSKSKTASFQFPPVVTSSQEMMQGFLDGYCDGDGERERRGGRWLFSSNRNFLAALATYLQTAVHGENGTVARVYISNRWYQSGWRGKHGFHQESEFYVPADGTSARVISVRGLTRPKKPYTVYSLKCAPYPSFLMVGHLV
jgi:GTP cyclohydrolase I